MAAALAWAVAVLTSYPETLSDTCVRGCTWLLLLWIVFRLAIRPYLRSYGTLRAGSVVVTGCDYGFGKVIAMRFHREGATVFAGCLSDASAEKLLEEIPVEARSTLRPIVLDVTKQADVDRVRDEVLKSGLPVRAVVNNAGVSAFGWAEMLPASRYEFNMNVNYHGVVRMTKAFMPLLRQSRGRLINIGSIGARMPSAFGSAYLSTKAAMTSYTECVRQEVFRFGVRVCLIEPGFFATELLTNGRTQGAVSSTDSEKEVLAAYPSYEKKMEATAQPIQVLEALNGGKRGLDYVSDAVVDAACSWFPLPRYIIGYDAQLINYVLAYIPPYLQDWVQTLSG